MKANNESTRQIKVSVIIPVYNEEKTIIDVLEKVNHQKINSISMEIIVINDGSKDHSLELLKNNPKLYTKLINFEILNS